MSNDAQLAEQAEKQTKQAKAEKPAPSPYEKFRTAHEKDGGLNIYDFRATA